MVPWIILLSELVTTVHGSGVRSSAGEVHILAASEDIYVKEYKLLPGGESIRFAMAAFWMPAVTSSEKGW